MDRPLVYRGGPQVVFQRAESAAFFGREIGLMYTHAHLRYAQAMVLLGDAQEMWDALQLVNPVAVTDRLPQASLRQRNPTSAAAMPPFTTATRRAPSGAECAPARLRWMVAGASTRAAPGST
jgi:cellobiose phosphorylase